MAYRAMGDAPKSIQLLCAQWCSRRHVTLVARAVPPVLLAHLLWNLPWFSQQQSRGFDGVDRYGLCPAHIAHTAGIHTAHLASLLCFRLGAHDLGVAVGRWHGVSRADRMCNWCSLGCRIPCTYYMELIIKLMMSSI